MTQRKRSWPNPMPPDSPIRNSAISGGPKSRIFACWLPDNSDTMSFIHHPIAGPSRVPLYSIRTCQRLLQTRRYATTPSTSDDPNEDMPLPFPLDTDTADTPPTPREEDMDRDTKASAVRAKKMWASGRGIAEWKKTFGTQFLYSHKGQRAKWLGGDVVSLS